MVVWEIIQAEHDNHGWYLVKPKRATVLAPSVVSSKRLSSSAASRILCDTKAKLKQPQSPTYGKPKVALETIFPSVASPIGAWCGDAVSVDRAPLAALRRTDTF